MADRSLRRGICCWQQAAVKAASGFDHALKNFLMAFDDGNKPDILFLAHRVPYPPDKGDRIRTFHILRFLARRASIHLACLADEPVAEAAIRALSEICRRVHIVPLGHKTRMLRAFGSLLCRRSITQGAFSSAGIRQIVLQWAQETKFHAAMTSASSMVPYLRLAELCDVPAIVDMMDVDSQKWLDYSRSRSWPLSWVFRTEGHRLRLLEQEMSRWARAALLVSEAEADLFRSFCPWPEVHAVTNGVDLDYFQAAAEPPVQEDCVFVGALDYYPNVDAALWFCREVWPALHRCRPQATFLLVGRRPAAAVRRLADLPGVRVVGQVPDVRPYVSGAAVVVVPLRIARGLQNKVLEALAMGKAVVASPAALAALQTQPGVHLLAASSAEDWIQAVANLLEKKERRRELGAAGRKFVEEHHTWDHCLEPIADLVGLPDTRVETIVGRDRELCR
jgi:sugar transferase (PEP-CTERM/EpsH1 system associated)